MWNVIKLPIERLTPESFTAFGHVINTFQERQPELAKGGYRTKEMEVFSETGDEPIDGPAWYEPHPDRVPISEGLQRAHFAFHTDAGQSFYPKLHTASIFIVGPIQNDIQSEELSAFYSDGNLGVCLHLGVWHTMPICVRGREIYQTTRGNQDYLQHSVEIDFDLERNQTIEPDIENFII